MEKQRRDHKIRHRFRVIVSLLSIFCILTMAVLLVAGFYFTIYLSSNYDDSIDVSLFAGAARRGTTKIYCYDFTDRQMRAGELVELVVQVEDRRRRVAADEDREEHVLLLRRLRVVNAPGDERVYLDRVEAVLADELARVLDGVEPALVALREVRHGVDAREHAVFLGGDAEQDLLLHLTAACAAACDNAGTSPTSRRRSSAFT